MESHSAVPCVRCLMLFACVLALQSGLVELTEDLSICDSSESDTDSEISVYVGHDLSISCLTDIEPPRNQLTWFKNNNAIGDDPRIVITGDRVPCTLTDMTEEGGNGESCDSLQFSISNITLQDEGLYICRGVEKTNGTIFVRVLEEILTTKPTIVATNSVTTTTTFGTTSVTPSLTKPTCSSNASLDVVLASNDNIAFTCMTDEESFSVGSLDWVGFESMQINDSSSHSTTIIMDVRTALMSMPLCRLSCMENVQDCKDDGLSCSIRLHTVTPLQEEADVGGNVSFTCEVQLKNYTVIWFAPNKAEFNDDQLNIQSLNDGRTSIFTISNLQPDQSGSLFCIVQRKEMPIGTSWSVRYEVVSSSNISSSTEDSGRSLLVEQTDPTATTPQPRSTGCVYLRRIEGLPSSSPLSLNLIIIIAVIGGVALVIIIAIIICVVCCRRRVKEPAIDINPVMAFGDLSHDNPVNMDVHFNVYTQHEIYDEAARSSRDILHLDSTRRIPSVIHGRNHAHDNGHAERTSSFIPISEDQADTVDRRKNDDDQPGRKLSYFVENDVYVSYDSNA